MNNEAPETELFERLADSTDRWQILPAAPARLKARIYSALVRQQQRSGPLSSLTQTKAEGRDLCVFEQAWSLVPVGEGMKRLNLCQVCHARLLAEKMEKAPIYWSGCPYADFHKA
jgi:hypothetical protein